MAIHYFYASSTLLQEGVKAGLSLYDIAVCCYRNDDFDLVTQRSFTIGADCLPCLELLTSLLKTDCRCYASASRAIADAIVQAPNALPNNLLKPVTCVSSRYSYVKTFDLTSESPDSKDWACGIVDRVLSMKYRVV